jgi:hypothetical protein
VPPLLSVRDLRKSYLAGHGNCWARVPVLRGLSFDVAAGQRLAIVGGAASGKTTLLQCLAGLRRPDGGEIRWSDPDRPGRLYESPWHLGAAPERLPLIDADAADCAPTLWSEALDCVGSARGWLLVTSRVTTFAGLCDAVMSLDRGRLRPVPVPPRARWVAEP